MSPHKLVVDPAPHSGGKLHSLGDQEEVGTWVPPVTQECSWNGTQAAHDSTLPSSTMHQECFPSGGETGIKLKEIKIVRLCRMTGQRPKEMTDNKNWQG